MASKKRKAKAVRAPKRARKQKVEVNLASDGIVVPEKRNKNFFSRIKESNVQFAKAQAKAKGICHSEYVDLLIEREKNGGPRAVANEMASST